MSLFFSTVYVRITSAGWEPLESPSTAYSIRILAKNYDNASSLIICVYLPLFQDCILPHFNSAVILPRSINHMSCTDVVELANISKVAEVPIAAISGLAFVFLSSNVTNYMYHIQGMQDAYIVRYKLSIGHGVLVELRDATFFSFPD
jgi:hypothetical protein